MQTNILAKDKLLPTQGFNSELYKGEDYVAALHGLLGEFSPQLGLSVKGHNRVAFEEMSTPPAQLALIRFLISITGAKTFLEIGTFIGNTAMSAARFMGDKSYVVTIEQFSEFADIAQQNFIDNGFTNIRLLQGDAELVMVTQPDKEYDIIYIDGCKQNYLKLTQLAEKKLSHKGIIIIDDVGFHGDALNESPGTDKGEGCKQLLDHYRGREDMNKIILPIGNCMLMLSKK